MADHDRIGIGRYRQILFTGLSPHGNYAGEIVPSLILTGLVATFIPKRTATPVSQPAAPEPKRHRNHDGLPEPGPRSRQR